MAVWSQVYEYRRKCFGGDHRVSWLLASGYTNTQIAAKLCLSVGTVKNYVSSIYDKTGNRERTDIIWYGSLARLFRLDWYIGDNIGMAVRGNGIVFKQWRTVSQVRAVFMKEILQWLEKFTKTN